MQGVKQFSSRSKTNLKVILISLNFLVYFLVYFWFCLSILRGPNRKNKCYNILQFILYSNSLNSTFFAIYIAKKIQELVNCTKFNLYKSGWFNYFIWEICMSFCTFTESIGPFLSDCTIVWPQQTGRLWCLSRKFNGIRDPNHSKTV